MKTGRFKKIKFALRALISIAILAFIVFCWRVIGTEEGRRIAANEIVSRIPQGENHRFDITQLSWPTLRTIAADTVTIYDDDGAWLEIKHAKATVGLRALLHKTIRVNSLTADKVIMKRLPHYQRKKTDQKSSAEWTYDLRGIDLRYVETGHEMLSRSLNGSLKGRLKILPSGEGRGSITNAHIFVENEGFVLSSRFAWNKQRFNADNFLIRTQGAEINGSGFYSRITKQSELTLEAKAMNVQWLAKLINREAAGITSIRILVKHGADGTSMDWVARGDYLEYDKIYISGLTTSGSISSDSNRAFNTTFTIDAANIRAGNQMIEQLNARGNSESNQLLVTTSIKTTTPFDMMLSTRTAISRNQLNYNVQLLELSGSADRKSFSLVEPAQFTWSPPNLWMLTVGPINWKDTSIKAAVRFDNGFSSYGYVRSLDARAIPAIKQAGYYGDISADWNIRDVPRFTEGNINIRITNLRTDNERLSQLVPPSIRVSGMLAQSAITVEGRTQDSTNFSVFGHATLPCIWTEKSPWLQLSANHDSKIILRAKSDLEIFAQSFLPAWQNLRGNVVADILASGSITNPLITGSISLTNGFFEDVVRGTSVHDIQMVAEAEKDSSFRFHAYAHDGHRGNVALTGTYARVGQEPFILQAGALFSNFTAGRVFSTEIPIDGQLTLTGTGTTAQLYGELDADAITIRLPRQLPPSIRNIKVIDLRAAGPGSSVTNGIKIKRFPLSIETDIRVGAVKGVRINGNQLRSEWRGGGRITGQIPDVRFGGSVAVVRGSFMFLGRRFTISRGEVIIPTGRSSQPTIFVTADTRAAGVNIQLNVDGSADEPTLTLTSEPPLEKNEIVSRLLFGKSGDAVSPFQIAYLAYALDVLEGGGPLLQKLDKGESMLGLDQLDVKQSEEESGLSAVMLGKRLNDRFYLEGEVGLKDEPDVLAVEAEITPHLILRTETSPRIREGISINWRKDY